MEKLATFALDEPQLALTAFNVSVSKRWSFIQRTIEDTSELFLPLESCIRENFIPAIVGRQISDLEREMLSLPYRYGGLGITDPSKSASFEYSASKQISSCLTNLICNQDMDVTKINKEQIKQTKSILKREKESRLKEIAQQVKEQLDETHSRYFDGAQDKGASAWLACLPLKSMGYVLNRREFQDAISLRYGWPIKDMPTFCACGNRNNIEHSLTCKRGSFVSMRHNAVRDTEAAIMREVSEDVIVEPMLIPVGNTQLMHGTNIQNQARLDISATGIWSTQEKTFFDVRITNPYAASNVGKTLEHLLEQNEKQKEKEYQDRVLQVEKASFVPLVYTTNGGMGKKCAKLHQQLALRICAKKMDIYSKVMAHLRTRLRFSLLRSILVAIRGYRGQRGKDIDGTSLEDIDFGTVDV